jgi:hypothetical protein
MQHNSIEDARRRRYRARQVSSVALSNSIPQERKVGKLPMTKLLRISNGTRFVGDFALVIDPGTPSACCSKSAPLGSRDLSLVRRTREALDLAYDRASNMKDWDQAHSISALREALAQADSAAYLAYRGRGAANRPGTQPPSTPKPSPSSAVQPTPWHSTAGCGRSSRMASPWPSGGSGSGSCSLAYRAMSCPSPGSHRPQQA